MSFLLLKKCGAQNKGRWGGGTVSEIMDSNTSLPAILSLSIFWLFLRSVLTDRILP